jgi:hypothetical protein
MTCEKCEYVLVIGKHYPIISRCITTSICSKKQTRIPRRHSGRATIVLVVRSQWEEVNVRLSVCALRDQKKHSLPLSSLLSSTNQHLEHNHVRSRRNRRTSTREGDARGNPQSVTLYHKYTLTDILAVQARAVFGPEYPVKTTFEVVISKQKNINTTKQSKMELNGYTAHIIAYDQPSSFAHWKHVMSTEGGRSARDAYDELLDKLRERFSAVMGGLYSFPR